MDIKRDNLVDLNFEISLKIIVLEKKIEYDSNAYFRESQKG